MKKNLLFRLYIVFIIVLQVSCTTDDNSVEPEAKPPLITVYEYSAIELETMSLINEHRVKIGLNPLEKINHVSHKSEEHAKYMIANNVVNHDDFSLRSENIINVLGAIKVSENIAYNYNSAQGAFDAWMKSSDHKEIIEGNFSHFGISIRENTVNKRKYYTNIFVKM